MEDSLAVLHRKVAFGQSEGKIIWQPRIGCWFGDKLFAGETLPPPWSAARLPRPPGELTQTELDRAITTQMDEWLPVIYRDLGCSARIYQYNRAYRRIEHPDVHLTTSQLDATDTETVVETPVGRQSWRIRRMADSPSAWFVKRPVETEAEMRVAAWRARHAAWEWDAAAFEAVHAIWGDLGAPTIYLPRMNVQDLYINTMGSEAGIYALYDWPAAVEDYFEALETCHNGLIDLVNASPVEIVNFGENLHAGTLPPNLFRKYHLPECRRRCERLRAAGKFVSSHWDGETRALLPMARETGLDGIEAITPAPQGDVTFAEIQAGLGDDMFLLDGLPAVYFDRTFPVSLLEEATHELITRFAPRLILGISDEISSTGDIERIRIVGDIVARYNRSRESKRADSNRKPPK